MVDVTGAQRRRSAALVCAMVLLAAGGALSRLPHGGRAPAPCPRPALRGDVLVCDGAGAPAGARAWLAGHKLDVNTANERAFEALPGVGPSLAHAIVAARAARGGFTSLDELDDVPGIGPKTLDKLRAFLEVSR